MAIEPATLEQAEIVATDILRHGLSLQARPRPDTVSRIIALAGRTAQWDEDVQGTKAEGAILAVIDAAYLVGMAVGKRLRTDALNPSQGL